MVDDLLASRWVPVRIRPVPGGELRVDWCDLTGISFEEPFFGETANRALSSTSRPPVETGLGVLSDIAARSPGAPLGGLIFHLSRCGSTLLVKMLDALPGTVALSEPDPIDHLLMLAIRGALPRDAVVSGLRSLVAVLGRAGGPDKTRLFVKLSAWHILALPAFREAFPQVPWVFVFRDPLEVLVSQQRIRATMFLPVVMPPQIFGLDLPSAVALDPDGYVAHALGVMMSTAERFSSDRGLLVDYTELPGALTRVLSHFGESPSSADLQQASARAAMDAKAPGRVFVPDTASKRQEASDSLRRLAGQLRPAYERLLAKRKEVG
jgi:hypothetical protein